MKKLIILIAVLTAGCTTLPKIIEESKTKIQSIKKFENTYTNIKMLYELAMGII